VSDGWKVSFGPLLRPLTDDEVLPVYGAAERVAVAATGGHDREVTWQFAAAVATAAAANLAADAGISEELFLAACRTLYLKRRVEID
jgi:hypothetical protein